MNINPLKMFSSLFGSKIVETTAKTESITLTQETKRSRSTKKELDKDSAVFLLREATKLKHNDSSTAIELIKKAIELEPDEQGHVLKLVTYLYKSGQKEEAYDTCRELIRKLDLNDFIRYNLKKTLVLEKLCTLYYNDQNFEGYLAAHTDWLYNILIGYACQGKQKEIKKIILDKNKLKHLSPVKINGCFVKLNRAEEKEEYNNELGLMIETISGKLFNLVDSVTKARKGSRTRDAMIEKLMSNDLFIGVYKELNE